MSAMRDTYLALACLRLGLDPSTGRGYDDLPAAVLATADGALVARAHRGALRRAFARVTTALLDEIQRADPTLADRLAPPLGELVRTADQALEP